MPGQVNRSNQRLTSRVGNQNGVVQSYLPIDDTKCSVHIYALGRSPEAKKSQNSLYNIGFGQFLGDSNGILNQNAVRERRIPIHFRIDRASIDLKNVVQKTARPRAGQFSRFSTDSRT